MKRTAGLVITLASWLITLPSLVRAQTFDFAWVVNPDSGQVVIVNATTGRLDDVLSVSGAPFAVTVSPDGAFAYVAKSNLAQCSPCTVFDSSMAPACTAGTVSVIDAVSREEVASIPVDLLPVGIAASLDGTRVYVANVCSGNHVSVIGTTTKTAIATIQTTGFAPSRIALTPAGLAYVTHHLSNTVGVIDTSLNVVRTTIAVGGCPYGIAVTPDGSAIYVANAGPSGVANPGPGCATWTGTGSVSVIDTVTNTVVATIDDLSMSVWPDVTVTPDGKSAYVANCGPGICVIDTATQALDATIATGVASGSHYVAAFTTDGTTGYALCPSGLCSIDVSGGSVGETLPIHGYDLAIGRTRLSEIDHFKCYKARTARGTSKFQKRTVTLSDEFETKDTLVRKPTGFCTPVGKDGEAIQHPTAHLECYKIKDVSGQTKFTARDVVVDNDFGTGTLTVRKADTLCVPAGSDEETASAQLDHFKCYKTKRARGSTKFGKRIVSLSDEFEAKTTTVIKPVTVCNPVDKNGEGVQTPLARLECYRIRDVRGQPKFTARNIDVTNQFGAETLKVRKADTLCVPSLSSAAP